MHVSIYLITNNTRRIYMHTKSLILSLAFLILPGTFIFADEGMKNQEAMDQVIDAAKQMRVATEEDIKNLPNVGNKICPVSASPVDDGTMGESVKYVYNGKIYNLCCQMCTKDFQKNPEKFSAIAEKEVNEVK
jgi:YHS domain-containing protein